MNERRHPARVPMPANPVTQKRFRRQVQLQVYLPLLAALLALVTLVIVLSLQGVGDVSVWADASLVLMTMPICLVGLVLLVAAGAAALGVMRLIGVIPPYTYRVQQGLAQAARQVQRVVDGGARPVMVLNVAGASARAALRWLRWQLRRDRRG